MLSKRATHLQVRNPEFREVQYLHNITQVESDKARIKSHTLNYMETIMKVRKRITGVWWAEYSPKRCPNPHLLNL